MYSISQLNYVKNILGIQRIFNFNKFYTVYGSIDCECLFFIYERYEKENKELILRIARSLNIFSYAVVLIKDSQHSFIIENIAARSAAKKFIVFGPAFLQSINDQTQYLSQQLKSLNEISSFHIPHKQPIRFVITHSLREFQTEFYDENTVKKRKMDSFSVFKLL